MLTFLLSAASAATVTVPDNHATIAEALTALNTQAGSHVIRLKQDLALSIDLDGANAWSSMTIESFDPADPVKLTSNRAGGDGLIRMINGNTGGTNTLALRDIELDGSSNGRVVRMQNGGALQLTRAIVRNGFDSGMGGAIRVEGIGSVTILDSEFYDSDAQNEGGTLWTDTSVPTTVTDSRFQGSVGTYRGGAIYSRGQLTVTNSDFVSNTVSGDRGGGAVYFDNGIGVLVVDNSRFTTNASTATLGGGAIHVENSANNSRIQANVFTQNTSGGDGGGAVYLRGNTNPPVLTDNVFDRNTTTGSGGAVFVHTGNSTLRGGMLCSNDADGEGGALRWQGGLIENANFRDHQADAGGAIKVLGTTTINHVTLVTQSASSTNEGEAIDGGTITVRNSAFVDTTVGGGTSDVIMGAFSLSHNVFTNTLAEAHTGGAAPGSIYSNSNHGIGGGSCTLAAFEPDCDGSLIDAANDGTNLGAVQTCRDLDMDNDGSPVPADCDDNDPARFPGNSELCDGVDNDCDSTVDDGLPLLTWYTDTDGDTWGISAGSVMACNGEQPAGSVNRGGDCNDGVAAINPGASEVCDAVDNNCSSQNNEGLPAVTWYPDADLDGAGATGAPLTTVCIGAQPAGSVQSSNDCDDTNFATRPGRMEICDGENNDCNAGIPADETDVDGDQYVSCVNWVGDDPTVLDDGDCNDNDARRYPTNAEVCDGRDNDCANGLLAAELDPDGDGYAACTAVSNVATGFLGGDCGPTVATIRPGAMELCDGLDNNCASGVPANETDDDGDGWVECAWAGALPAIDGGGDCVDTNDDIHPTHAESCDGLDSDCVGGPGPNELDADGDGQFVCAGDCDDFNPERFQGNPEECDGIDNNCNTTVDEGLTLSPYFFDQDADGYGNSNVSISACGPSAGYVSLAGDCANNDPARNPGATEICNNVDDNCNSLVDDNPNNTLTGFRDADDDGFGDPDVSQEFCFTLPATGWVSEADLLDGEDCNDLDDLAWTDNPEVCGDGSDNDCEGTVDGPDADGAQAWFPDLDNDGHGDGDEGVVPVVACTAPPNHRASSDDCDDTNPTTFPGAPEQCNEADDDCDGAVETVGQATFQTWYVDADLDSFGIDGPGNVVACERPDLGTYSLVNTDCDDGQPTANPNGSEVCATPYDDNCNGDLNDDPNAPRYYIDSDGDTWGDVDFDVRTCNPTIEEVEFAGDCDDSTALVSPTANEICDNIDNDCDGFIDEDVDDAVLTWLDADGDGYGDPATGMLSCETLIPLDRVLDATDCDDSQILAWSNAPELCNDGVDNDCDGLQDDADPTVDPGSYVTFYGDGDGDGWAPEGAVTLMRCETLEGYVDEDHVRDCDDADPDVHPDALEICDTIDNDCDLSIDEGDAAPATWFDDADNDGFGDATASSPACTQPLGAVADATDCDDASPLSFPGAVEVCDDALELDEDCDGVICISPPTRQGGCSCDGSTGGGSGLAGLVLLLGALTVRRRRAA